MSVNITVSLVWIVLCLIANYATVTGAEWGIYLATVIAIAMCLIYMSLAVNLLGTHHNKEEMVQYMDRALRKRVAEMGIYWYTILHWAVLFTQVGTCVAVVTHGGMLVSIIGTIAVFLKLIMEVEYTMLRITLAKELRKYQ